MRTHCAILRASSGGAWRDHPGRLVLAILGIAFGVALGVAVHLINASAANEFNLAVRSLAGEADLVVRGPRSGFPDSLYPYIAKRAGVRAASPGVELDAQLAGRHETIKVLGLDPFRALQVQPHLLLESRDALLDMLKPGVVLLSRSAADELGLKPHDTLRLQSGTQVVTLRIAALLPAGATGQRVAVMDIAQAQWIFGRVGELHRIDVKLEPGASTARFSRELAPLLPAGTIIATPEAEAERSASLSRAYRTNLDMLALVALFTGAFLVFSTQFLALVRRRSQLALLRVIGVTGAELTRALVIEGAVLGIAGSALGVALGVGLARIGIARLGGDLGAGYFHSVAPALHVDPAALAVFFALGLLFAMLGAALPALEAARRAPALALKAGDEEEALSALQSVVPSLALFAAAWVLAQAPPVGDLPIAGYFAVAAILVGAILAMPRFAQAVLSRLPPLRYAPATLAAAQLQATPRQVGVSLAAILASFSLMVSMLIMVGSFRDSLAAWLDQMLPADLYVRAGRLGDAGFFTPDEQARIGRVAGVASAAFIRSQNVYLRTDRPPLSLLARPLPRGGSAPALPFEGPVLTPGAGDAPPAWLSEVAADVLRVTVGATIDLPIGTGTQPKGTAAKRFVVAGIWRDYARQNGAIVVDRATYVALTGDERANEAALTLDPGARADAVAEGVRAAVANEAGVETISTRELKAVSLAIFDRTFAVTYALEVAAVLIGMFGVSASFSAQALARRREFGVLRHLGMTRRQVGAMLACEGAVVGSLGVAAGLAFGWLISLILVHVINRQSFHWSMDMTIPWRDLAVLGAALVAAATVTAMLSGRRAMSGEVTRAVREDW
ncbi:MAG: h16 [Betaproteobacteria bacterium]|nr:h16 [Betaproteobacteria bacterium]